MFRFSLSGQFESLPPSLTATPFSDQFAVDGVGLALTQEGLYPQFETAVYKLIVGLDPLAASRAT